MLSEILGKIINVRIFKETFDLRMLHQAIKLGPTIIFENNGFVSKFVQKMKSLPVRMVQL
jgi:hypothetical protein